jgi:hypothetical protein
MSTIFVYVSLYIHQIDLSAIIILPYRKVQPETLVALFYRFAELPERKVWR